MSKVTRAPVDGAREPHGGAHPGTRSPREPARRRGLLRACAWATGVALALAASSAHAQPSHEPSDQEKETARNLLDLGDQAARAGHFDDALKDYEGADAIMGVPTTGIEVGRTLDALGRLIEARARLLQVARMPVKPNEPAAFTNARTEAGELAQRIADRIPAIQVQVTGPSDTKSVRLLIDGTPQPSAMLGLPIKVNPGKHQVSVQAEGYTTDTQTLSVSERETRAHKVTLRTGTGTAPNPVPPTPVPPGPAQPAPTPGPLPGPSPVPGPTPTPTPQPDPLPPKGTDPDTSGGGGVSPLLIAGFSIAGAGVLVGAITGGISIARTKSLKKECVDGECPDSVTNDLRSANTLANVSNATFAIAGVGAILGIVGIFVGGDPDASGTAQPQPASVRLEPYFGADVLGLRGRF